MNKARKMLPYLCATAATFYLLPLFGRDTGSFMLVLLVVVPLFCFAVAFLYGSRWGFSLFYPLIVAIIFIPTIFIYYNKTAWIYAGIYALIALTGSILGARKYK